ncbi:NAD-dependent epimerase/dehydratase family protein [Aquirufa antheringensis]|uniref:NAD-dependent epimerase/dehydratase family protein n=1 Tax=Aquirufa antheringensis TaxID=2516559 RepID=UPI0022A8A4B3|nr:NAD-dependent epimerase/dehydratase family protein [Aquirufa antheringensis]MCZ2486941.1 NAD-dependent epimerase/dehydratase family protein [Aquirufa antheringensis]
MKDIIFISGASGFVGSAVRQFFSSSEIITFLRGEKIEITDSDIVLHLAGKAHDLKKVSSPDDYYKVNTELTKDIFDAFLASDAKVFITLSSVKAVADEVDGELTEYVTPNPITHYGKSKLLAEQYILSQPIPEGKRVYILRPCMIHGPGNKGNLNLLYSLVSKGLPWPLGLFENSRSYLSIENLCFIIKELIEREDIPSGVYNVADDVPLSTNEVINMIAVSKGKKAIILNLSQTLIKMLASVGDVLKLPLNSERLQKLTESYIVSNAKIKKALGKQLPVSSKEGLIKTFKSFAGNV